MSPERVKFEESRPNLISNGSRVRIIVTDTQPYG